MVYIGGMWRVIRGFSRGIMDRIRVVGLADWIWLKTRSRNQDADRRFVGGTGYTVSERFWGGDVTFVTCRLTHVVNDVSVIQIYSGCYAYVSFSMYSMLPQVFFDRMTAKISYMSMFAYVKPSQNTPTLTLIWFISVFSMSFELLKKSYYFYNDTPQ